MQALNNNSSFAAQTLASVPSGRDLPSVRQAKTTDQARKVAEDFEAVFLSQMLKPMFANLGAEKPFGGGAAEDMWRGMQIDEYGKAISKAGGVGIADSVFREILKAQEMN